MVTCPSCGREAEEAAKLCPHCGNRLRAPMDEQLKVVTVVFCEIARSTELTERLGPVLHKRVTDAFGETVRRVVDWRDGEPGGLMGDEIMAVFGVPVARADGSRR